MENESENMVPVQQLRRGQHVIITSTVELLLNVILPKKVKHSLAKATLTLQSIGEPNLTRKIMLHPDELVRIV